MLEKTYKRIPVNHILIQREIRMECLSCGISLLRDIMDRKIRLHLCSNCRKDILDNMTKEVTASN